jgi:hypothetical protein
MTWGTPVVFESSAIDDIPYITAGGNRIHVTYRDSSGNGGIRSASISGTTPTFAAETAWGTPQSTLGTTELSTTHGVATGKTIDTVYDTTSDRFVTIYADLGNSNYGTAVVHYISNTETGATTYGTPVVFESGDISDNGKASISADTNTSRVVIAYRDGGDSNNGKAIVGSVTSGTNAISFGTAVTFNAAHTQYPVIVEDPNTNKQAIFYRNFGDSGHGYGIVGTVTGGIDNSIAFGTAVKFNATDTLDIAAAYSPDTNKILVAYAHNPGGQITGKSHVATISGTDISYGDQDEWEPQRPYLTSMAYDETANKFVIAYNNQNESGHGYMIVGTMSGTDMTYGSDVKYEANSIDDLVVGYDPSQGKCYIMSYNSVTADLRMETVSISGTTPSNSTFVVDSTEPGSQFMGTAYDSDNGLVVVNYAHNSDDDLRTSVVKAADGYQPGNYHVAYDTANDYVVIMFYSNPSVYIRAVSHNTGDGTYTAVGAKTILNGGNIINIRSDMVYDPDTNRVVVAYMDNTNSDYMTSNVVQLGGTAAAPTVTIGSDVVIDSGDGSQIAALTYDTTNNKVFLAYDNNGDGKVRGAIGTVTSGTNAISFTTPADIWDYSSGGDYFDVIYDDDKDRVMFFYRDDDNSNALTYKIITSGASSFSVADGAVISSSDNRLNGNAASFGAGKGVLVALWDAGNSNKVSYATTRFVATTVSTLDNGNYLGIAAEAISDTATGKINVIGGTSTGHSSLTIGNHYFTNGAGTIGLVGNTTGEQYLGRAISATEIQLLENEGYLYGTADGAITAGKPVQVKSDGDFQMISETTTSYSFAQGSSADVEQGTNTHGAIYYDDDLNKMVVINADASPGGGLDKLTIFYGTVTGGTTNSISFDTGNVIGDYTNVTLTNIAASFDPISKTTLVGVNNGSAGQAFAFTRSSTTSISHGTIGVSFYGGNPDGIDIVNVGENKWVIGYQQGSNYPAVRVATASGTTLSFGTEVVVNSSNSASSSTASDAGFSMSYDTGSSQVVVFFRNSAGQIKAKVGTVSGTDISFGSVVPSSGTFTNGTQHYPHPGGAAYVPAKDVHIVAYDKNNDGVVTVLKTSGTGSEATLVDASGTAPGTSSFTVFDTQPSLKPNIFVAYESTPVIVYSDDSVDINSIAVSIDGTTPTMGTDRAIETTTSDDMQMGAYDPDTKRAVIIFKENSDNDMMAQVIAVEGSETTTTMTTDGENYLGIATKTVANDAQAEVATFGQIDAQQSGLTAGQKYFVQSDGSLATSADTSVPGYTGTVTTVAGKALSATKLLISE